MAASTPSRFGQINGAGAVDALFLKMFGQEVMAAFEQKNIMMPLHKVKTVSSGKSWQFPALGRVTGGYHTPGAEITGQSINSAERIIYADAILFADTFVAEIDDLETHFDVRSDYVKELSNFLAQKLDKNVLQVTVLAARASATVTGLPGGTQLTNASYRTDGEVLAGGIFDAGQTLDENEVTDFGDRHCALKPAQYNLLAQTTKVINKDWDGAGSYSDGKVLKVDNITIHKTNHLPTTNISAEAGENNTYNGDFTNTAFAVWQTDAVGTVKLKDITTEANYDPRRFGHLMTSRMVVGTGILRPECAIEGKVA